MKKKKMDTHVQFVSYTGKYPTLCIGILTLRINGKDVRFGHEPNSYDIETGKYRDDNYDAFWSSGGHASFEGCITGEWLVDAQEIPVGFRQYIYEIDRALNENVDFGCCGGCL